jgi:hypothetical protein
MNARIGEVRADMKDMRAEYSGIRAESHRDFRWVVGIQLTTMAAVLAAVVAAYYR